MLFHVQLHSSQQGLLLRRCRTNADAKVVAHNRKMLLLFNGHVNIEFSGTVNLIMYLYKVHIHHDLAVVSPHDHCADQQVV